MRDQQVRLQWQQVKISSGFGVVAALFFLLCRFSSMAVLQVDSKEEATLLMAWRHVPLSSTSVVHSRWLMLQALRDFLECLYSASLVPLCFGGQKQVCHAKWSWASDGLPSWKHVLPSVVLFSTTWTQCWWCLLHDYEAVNIVAPVYTEDSVETALMESLEEF